MSTVQEPNKLYQDAIYQRKLCRDSSNGSSVMKRNNILYLPMPVGYLHYPLSPNVSGYAPNATPENREFIQSAPWYHQNKAYSAYLQRARYPEFVSVARNGLVGIATKQDPVIKLPRQIEYLISDAGKNKEGILTVFAQLIAETLLSGNVFPVLNINTNDNLFYIDIITAEEAIDWDESEAGDGVTFFNIMRAVDERSPTNQFLKERVIYNYVLRKIDKEVNFTVYKNGVEESNAKNIAMQGRNFNRVPVFPIGATENKCKPQMAPLNGLAEICLSIYRKDADLSNAQYMTCNPNLVITGVSEGAPNTGYDDQSGELDAEFAGEGGVVPVVAGSQVAMQFSNPDAKVFYTKTDTSALDHVLQAIKDLFQEAAIYSLSLTSDKSSNQEAEGTVKMRQGFQSATLISVVKNVTEQLRNLLKFAAEVEGASPDSVEFEVNFDFSDKTISVEFFKALIQLFVARGLSLETLLGAAQQAGVHIEDIAQELGKINNQEPVL